MSFQLETDEKSFAGSSLILQTIREIQEAFAQQRKLRKLTQQALATKLGLKHRSIVNRWLRGSENLSLRTIGELAWALNKRAVIKFEDCDGTNGNFFDAEPHSVRDNEQEKSAPKEKAAPKVIRRDVDPSAWGRAPNTVHRSSAVLENA